MGSTSSGTRAVGSVRLDRVGRILVRLGSLVAVVLVALPVLGLALFSLSFASLGAAWHVATLLELTLPAIAIVAAVIVTIVMMLKGGTVSLTLGGIAAFIVGTVALVFLLQGDGGWWVLEVLAAPVGAGAFALALGAAFRLIARRTEPGGR